MGISRISAAKTTSASNADVAMYCPLVPFGTESPPSGVMIALREELSDADVTQQRLSPLPMDASPLPAFEIEPPTVRSPANPAANPAVWAFPAVSFTHGASQLDSAPTLRLPPVAVPSPANHVGSHQAAQEVELQELDWESEEATLVRDIAKLASPSAEATCEIQTNELVEVDPASSRDCEHALYLHTESTGLLASLPAITVEASGPIEAEESFPLLARRKDHRVLVTGVLGSVAFVGLVGLGFALARALH